MAADPSVTLSLDGPLFDVEQAAALLAVRTITGLLAHRNIKVV